MSYVLQGLRTAPGALSASVGVGASYYHSAISRGSLTASPVAGWQDQSWTRHGVCQQGAPALLRDRGTHSANYFTDLNP